MREELPLTVLLALYAFVLWVTVDPGDSIRRRDSNSYLNHSAVSMATSEFWSGKRAFTVPLLYKPAQGDPATIVRTQVLLSAAGWSVLAFAVASCFAARRLRLAVAATICLTALASAISGWTRLILSESISFSLMALVAGTTLALAAALRRERFPWGWMGVWVTVLALWAGARDANIYSVVSIGLVFGVWLLYGLTLGRRGRPTGWWIRRLLPVVLLSGLVVTVAHSLTFASQRFRVPILNVVLTRVLPESEIYATWRDRYDLPENATMERWAGLQAWSVPPGEKRKVNKMVHGPDPDPRLNDVREWIDASGVSSYRRYLLWDGAPTAWIDTLGLYVDSMQPQAKSYLKVDRMPAWTVWLSDALFVPLRRSAVVVGSILIVGACAATLRRRSPERDLGVFTLLLLANSGIQFFVGYHGDASAEVRHTFSHLILFRLALLCALWILATRLCDLVRRRWSTAGRAAVVATSIAAAASCAAPAPSPAPDSDRTNVVLIVVDTLRKDHLGCYGHPRDTSPNIDRLATTGTRYEMAISQAPWTTPSIGSLLTSLYPSTLGIKGLRSVLADDYVLLAEVLADRGYATGAVVSHDFCSAAWGFDQGFAEFDESNIVGYREVSAPGVSDAALDFLERRGDEPFFLFLHYFDPHNKYLLHEEFDVAPAGDYAGPVNPSLSWAQLRRRFSKLTVNDVDEIRRYYDSEIAFTDHHIGRVLDRLESTGRMDDTLIVFTSDHGEEFGDHGKIGHARTLFQELVNVPLVVHYPGRDPDVVADPVALLDVYPTVLDVAGIPLEHPVEGRSLLAPPSPRVIFSETSRMGKLRALVSGEYKLIRDLRDQSGSLYDLGADPGESVDVAGDRAAEVERLDPLLTEWIEQQLRAAPSEREIDLDEEQLERLRSLGYVDGGP